jgi:hypothetical protein
MNKIAVSLMIAAMAVLGAVGLVAAQKPTTLPVKPG